LADGARNQRCELLATDNVPAPERNIEMGKGLSRRIKKRIRGHRRLVIELDNERRAGMRKLQAFVRDSREIELGAVATIEFDGDRLPTLRLCDFDDARRCQTRKLNAARRNDHTLIHDGPASYSGTP